MASPALDSGVTDLESFCAQLSTAIGALAAARPDLHADAQGYDTLLPALRQAYEGAESAGKALDDGIESAATRACDALETLAEEAGGWKEAMDVVGEAATWRAEGMGVELAEHARGIDAAWSALWSTAWTELRDGLGTTAADFGRWTEEADLTFTALDLMFGEAVPALDHAGDETATALQRAAESTKTAESALAGLHLHAPTVAEELEGLFAEKTGRVRELIATWEQPLAGEADVTRSAVETLAADAHGTLAQERTRVSAALDAMTAELEQIDLELSQTAADAADGREQAEQASALEPQLRETEARVASIRALMASMEPT
jgi:hypothetical protein